MARFLDVVPRIPVADLPRSIAFYSTTLGFTVDATWPDDGATFAILGNDDATFQLYVPAGGTVRGESIINIEVTDAQGVFVTIPPSVHVESEPEDFWYGRREFAIRDPDGHLVIVTQDLEEDEDENDGPVLTDRLLS